MSQGIRIPYTVRIPQIWAFCSEWIQWSTSLVGESPHCVLLQIFYTIIQRQDGEQTISQFLSKVDIEAK